MTRTAKVRSAAAAARRIVRLLSYGGRARWCPVCEKNARRFLPFGVVRRSEALCVHCGSLERHRFVWLYFSDRTDLFDGSEKTMLHIASERCLEDRLKRLLGTGYVTADLRDSGAMVEMDITEIGYPDESFDVIYCSHVLEHVHDDRRALRELNRVLKRDGWAILVVPITAGETFEDPTITDPEERLRTFGQADHVRVYGPDYVDRLAQAGFVVDVFSVGDVCSPIEAVRMGIASGSGEIFYCTRRDSDTSLNRRPA